MDELSMLWIVGVVALLIGAIIGILIARSSAGGRSRESLIEELNDTRRELETYKENVSQHFTQTADLVNRLTDSYRDVHHHLSNSAQKLCSDKALVERLLAQQGRPLLDVSEPAAEPETKEDAVEPPKDYAPRRDPKEAGTLSEQFGIQKRADEAEEQNSIDPSRAADATASAEDDEPQPNTKK